MALSQAGLYPGHVPVLRIGKWNLIPSLMLLHCQCLGPRSWKEFHVLGLGRWHELIGRIEKVRHLNFGSRFGVGRLTVGKWSQSGIGSPRPAGCFLSAQNCSLSGLTRLIARESKAWGKIAHEFFEDH